MPESASQGAASASRADQTFAEWRQAEESLDADRAVVCLADDVVLISPLTARFTFNGRDQVGTVLKAAYQVITEFRLHTETGDGDTRALFFNGKCGGQDFEEAQLLRLNDDGLIREITLYGRPLPGVTAVMKQIAPVLMRLNGRPRLATTLSLATAPLHGMAVSGERYLVPLADPKRGR